MAIVNRDLDPSQQNILLDCSIPTAIATGSTFLVDIVPSSILVKGIEVAAFGLSGAPTWTLGIQRFVAGAGITVITGICSTFTVTAIGTSGVMSSVLGTGGSGVPNGITLAASGSSLLALIPNDMVYLVTSAANTAALGAKIKLVAQAIQDVRSTFGQ